MSFIQLSGAAYTSRSLIAAAQRCLNLFPEQTPQEQGEPIQFTHYCTPGLTLVAQAPDTGCRCLYTIYNGDLYAVFGTTVLHLDSSNNWTSLGEMVPSLASDALPGTGPVSMCDNGGVLLIADGSPDGWFVDLTQPVASQTLTRIDLGLNTGWYGADTISYQDTFFIMNKPNSAQYYISLSNISATNLTADYGIYTAVVVDAGVNYVAGDVLTVPNSNGGQITVTTVGSTGDITQYGVTASGALAAPLANPVTTTGGTGTGATFNLTYTANQGAFNPLDYAAMSGEADLMVCAISARRNLWLLGNESYEIWMNTGGGGTAVTSFPFSIFPETFGNWGCAAKHSVVCILNQLFWLSQDKFGTGLVMLGDSLVAKRVSTHAIEVAISEYPTISDAIGMGYQQQGHVFYFLTFPSANSGRGATWVYDSTINQWHERCYIDDNGIEYRHLANAMSSAYGQVYVGDWSNSNLYVFDVNNYTDNQRPIKRVRSFPHQIDLQANRRVRYEQLIAQMQTGSAPESGSGQVVVDCDFITTSGTLLEDYSNINSLGASFANLGATEAQIVSDAVVIDGTGSMLYGMSGSPTQADYNVGFVITPLVYDEMPADAATMGVIVRANADNDGYQCVVESNGTDYLLALTVMPSGEPTSVTLGTLTSGSYEVTLQLLGSSITAFVQRTQDSTWCNVGGTWVNAQVPAISIQDSTYTAAGSILLVGNAPS